MKKILIVNNNMDVGGIQKSLINLLKNNCNEYDITLLLFSKSGGFLKDVPENVKIVTPPNAYRMLGMTKQELKKYPLLFVIKALLVFLTKLFNRRFAMRVLGLFQKKIIGYDVVISFSHLPHHNIFSNGCGEFVLDKTVCDNKVCVIHCDYRNSGYMTDVNNCVYSEFDKIACCSDSVKDIFLQSSCVEKNKVYTLRNFYSPDVIEQSKINTYQYDNGFLNLVSVTRLSAEKGVMRALEAIHQSQRKDIRYYVIGDGPKKESMLQYIKENNLDNQVYLLGEQYNPYRYMLNADFLFVPSFHEAAPMVFDEAKMLGLKIITTNTTSAMEMVGDEYGVVCENSTEGILAVLKDIKKVSAIKQSQETNDVQKEQFSKIIYS